MATLRFRGQHFEELARQGVETSFAGLRSRADLAGIVRAYRLWRLRPGIVLSSSVDAQVIGQLVALRAGAPHVTTEHGGAGLPRASHRRLLVRAVAPGVERVVAVSATQVGELRRLGYRPERIVVIPNGIPEPRPRRAREAVRQELGVGADEVLVLLVATLRPEKRAGLFVEIVRRAHAQEPRLRGVVAGGGPQLAHVRSLAAASGGVVSALGERDDVADLMLAADVVCLTSAVEGLPVVVLEAMALCRPLVASRVGGVPDAVADGSTGTLVAPGDARGFADALVALARAPERRRAMGEAARRAYLERYTLAAMLDRYADLLAPLTERSPRRRPLRVPAAGGTAVEVVPALRPIRPAQLVAAALSRGPGYEPQPCGTRFDAASVRGYYLDLSAKTTSATAEAPERLPPAGLAQLALGWWERSLAGDGRALERFDAVCELLLRRAEPRDGALLWPYAMPVPKYGLRPPWFSAMAQGQAASVFVRAAERDERAADLALRALRPLLERAAPFVVGLAAGPVLEEAPSEPPSCVLNGWIYALWGLWDAAVGLGSAEARELFGASFQALLAMLADYDTGWWSRYSLWAGGRDLAKPFYHRLHVVQLEALHRLTGEPDLAATAARWRGYDSGAAAVRAVLAKGRELLPR